MLNVKGTNNLYFAVVDFSQSFWQLGDSGRVGCVVRSQNICCHHQPKHAINITVNQKSDSVDTIPPGAGHTCGHTAKRIWWHPNFQEFRWGNCWLFQHDNTIQNFLCGWPDLRPRPTPVGRAGTPTRSLTSLPSISDWPQWCSRGFCGKAFTEEWRLI